MNLYDYWIDNNGVGHKISDMNDEYLLRCLSSVEKWLKTHKNYSVDDLDADALKEVIKTGTKAWCIINGAEYKASLEKEAENRGLL